MKAQEDSMFKRMFLASLVLAAPAMATKTQFFKHADGAAFEPGTFENVVTTNFGDLRLSRDVEPLLKDEGKYASIDAIVEAPDGTVYMGTTASGKLLELKDGKTTELADFGEASGIAAIVITPGGDVLVGVSGERAEIQIRRKGQPKLERLTQLPEGVQYIWSIALASDGTIYAGTGPDGQLFQISADGKNAKVIFDSEEDNLRALAILNDTIFVGTDPNGLILKVDRATGKAFVIYDAAETEVSSLLVDPRGGQIYAATSQYVAAAEDAASPPAAGGRPDGGAGTKPIAFEPGAEPKPGADHDAGEGSLKSEPASPAAADDAAGEGPSSRPTSQNANASAAGPKPVANANATPEAGEEAAEGNAVYRIDPQGFVSEVFRDKSMIFGLARQDDQLFIATGPQGTVYQLNLSTEEHSAIAKLRPAQVTAIASTNDARLLVGTGGGSAEAHVMSAALAKSGTYVSPVLDAKQVSQFGKLQVMGSVPEGATLTVSTRSGNIEDQDSPLWSDWTAPVPAARFTPLATPTARYAQYKLTFTSDGNITPSVSAIELAYLQPNVAPRIDSVTVTKAEPAVDPESGEVTASSQQTITWSTTEPNEDELRYVVSVRNGAGQPWTTIVKDLAGDTFTWDTRRVADGQYEVKVEASDALANAAGMGKTASRVAHATTVDNAPPAIGDIKVERARGNVTISLRAADRGGVISRLEYAVDEQEHWQTVPPSDMLNDSPDEQYTIVLPDPGQATRVVSLRCSDESGNTAHESVTVRPAVK